MLTPPTKLDVCVKEIFTVCLKNSVQVTVKMIQINFAYWPCFIRLEIIISIVIDIALRNNKNTICNTDSLHCCGRSHHSRIAKLCKACSYDLKGALSWFQHL